jgi:hypothetical protein
MTVDASLYKEFLDLDHCSAALARNAIPRSFSMRLKTAVIVMSLSIVCSLSRVSFADTLTFQTESTDPAPIGLSTYGNVYIYPFYFTYTGEGGTDTLVALACMNYERDINWQETWEVTPLLVSSVSPNDSIDGAFTGAQVLEDAYLFNEYAAASGDALLTSEIQYAIWSIMYSPINSSNPAYTFLGGFDTTSQGLAQDAINNAPTEPSSYFGNDVAFVPINGTQSYGGEPQIFMTDPIPPAVAPEPTSLVLLGTGLFGAVAFMRRKHGKA